MPPLHAVLVLFSSLTFLFLFLPLVLAAHLALPQRWRNGWLLLMSVVFYAWGGPTDAAILIASVLINHGFARRLSHPLASRKKVLRWGLFFNVCLLVSFKYLGFFGENVNGLLSAIGTTARLPHLEVQLPLGISFFTFQQMSMLWDLYREPQPERPKLGETALYVAFFPQLIAGPIVRYHDIIGQIRSRTHDWNLFHSGVQRFVIGLFRKVFVANTCGALADAIMLNGPDSLTSPAAWLGILAYSLQIYFDFAGYSDMAIGIGRMLGFRILENFNFPYIAQSIQEFWRRWHISLSSWFRDYVYIPLGGNRGSTRRTYVNLFAVFLLTGLWHGATWSFVFWGVFHGVFLVVERVGFKRVLDRLPSPVSWAYTLLVVMVGWVFFRIESFGEAASYVGVLMGGGKAEGLTALSFLTYENLTALALGLTFSTPQPMRAARGLEARIQGFLWPSEIARTLVLGGLFLLCVKYSNAGSFNPFIYFRF